MKVVIIVQARMTSTRLPGKVLKEVMGKPLLGYQLERLRRVNLADEIVVATTVNDTDLPIVELSKQLKVLCYRGSENDVLSRYFEAAKENRADAVVRVTSDCPLIDPKVIDDVIQFYIDNHTRYDYVANTLERTFPRGMDTEVFSFDSLQEAFYEATETSEREHVTLFIYRHSDRFRLGNIAYLTNESHHRWTVDTPQDFELIKNILEHLYHSKPEFSLQDVLTLLDKHPDWVNINRDINQKEI